ncbi:MAG: SDR family oxidoreductase, partial [Actinomycetia bacterium]|nr:SDR family oxidoreductase [Actinomycetes bacterium]
FAEKSVVITGAGNGIGEAMAERFARAGARVAVLDLDLEAAQRVATQIPAAMAIGVDVTDADRCREAIDRVVDEWGGVDVLINNAGITHVSAFGETELDVLHRVMDVNFWGAVNCTHAALSSLIYRGGRIVVTSSVAGFAPLALRTGYASSKHALHGFFDSLRSELVATDVSITIVCPFYVRTDLENIAGESKRPVTGRVAEPSEVADVIYEATHDRTRLLLPSEESRLAYELSRSDPIGFEEIMLSTIKSD